MTHLALWIWAAVGAVMAGIATAETIGRHRRARRVQAVLNARTTDRDWPEEQFLLGGDLDDYTATGIHNLDLYLRKEAEQ
ncbi:hypothetical protein [Streptomyces syringium]|uniref:hypothetical protein n=1 Tax=Streptomyces syringium TaxID=76729 RepID=UPI0037CFF813